MRISELSGAMLDQWVARAEGKCYTVNPNVWGNACINDLGRLSIAKGSWDCAKYFEPSKNWAHGGPIIEREALPLDFDGESWIAYFKTDAPDNWAYGKTPLIAAMRAFVASKYGDTVPDEK